MAAPESFEGTINLDIRDSRPDWTPFVAKQAPEGSPNVLAVTFGDTGLAAWSPFGGRNATIATVLRDAGWSTFWVGENHNVPVDEWHMGASKKNWPLAQGFDRFCGFIGGETNQWYPDLAEDNHYVDQPYQPEDGYHLSKDLADKALEFIRDSMQTAPDKPWYLWFCPGANHAPADFLARGVRRERRRLRRRRGPHGRRHVPRPTFHPRRWTGGGIQRGSMSSSGSRGRMARSTALHSVFEKG